jgi:hypothetical protein
MFHGEGDTTRAGAGWYATKGDGLFSGWLCYKRLAGEGSYNLSAILLTVELLAAELPLYLESIIDPGFCCSYALRVLKLILKFFVAAGPGTDSDNHNKLQSGIESRFNRRP